MKRFGLLKIVLICVFVLVFCLDSSEAGIDIGTWEATWIDREKDFNDYMEEYITQTTRALRYTKENRLMPKKKYKKREKKFLVVKSAYDDITAVSGQIRELLEAIDDNYTGGGGSATQLKPNRLNVFGRQVGDLVAAKKLYVKHAKNLRGGEDIDLKEIKVATKSLKHIVANVKDVYSMAKAMEESPPITPEANIEFIRRTAIPRLQNSITQMKYALAKVKKNPTLDTWTGGSLMQQACRDVQMSLGDFRTDRRFKKAADLQARFMSYETQMERAIRSSIRRNPEEEEDAVVDAYKTIEKDTKLLKKNFKRFKKSVGNSD